MDISRLKVGILHTLIGKNDGVSIVIDQTIKTMVKEMNIPLGNIFYLAGHSPPRLNTTLDNIFWHRNEENRYILSNYSGTPPKGFNKQITEYANHAKNIIAKFIEENELDLFIVHNSCHPSNFIYAIAAGMYFEERRKEGITLPRYLLWWHDSHFERARFSKPNNVIAKFLKYIPGPDVDGIVFINTEQPQFGRKYLKSLGTKNIKQYFDRKTCIIPNTCDIPWDYQDFINRKVELKPPQDQYNNTFYKDIGLIDQLTDNGYTIDNAVILLQHTRVVERKRIDIAIDYAIELNKKYTKARKKKAIVLLISGHSGDEHDSYRTYLENYYEDKVKDDEKLKKSFIMIFGESHILPNREVLVNKKYYAFEDVPGIVADSGGMGTYFSDVEGYGNNLLEMMALGLPVVINQYPVYISDVKPLGLKVAQIDNCKLTKDAVDQGYKYLENKKIRQDTIKHNLEVLDNMLNHKVMADKLSPLILNLFKYK
jgi:mannosylglucosylglycerate synthase